MTLKYLHGLLYLVIIPVLGYCCSTQLSPVYSQLSGSASFQFSVTPPTAYTKYAIRDKDNVPVLRITYSPTPGKIDINDNINTFTGDTSTGNLSFTLKSVQQDDYGVYNLFNAPTILQCRTLYILGKPTTPTLGSNTEPILGRIVTLTCTSTSTTVPSDHNLSMRYNWNVDDSTNPTIDRYTYSTSKHTLTLSDVTKGDSSKVFRCTATEVVTGGLTSDTSNIYSINVLYGPDTVTLNPNIVSYTENEGASLPSIQCSADCNPSCSYKWTRQEQIVNTTDTLSLGSLQRSEAGTYICTATNSQKTRKAQVVVIARYAPDVSASVTSSNLVEHSSVQLKCTADGVPNTYNYTGITQKWRGTTITYTRTPVSNTPLHSSLQFTDLQLQDTGAYTCHVNNGVTDLSGNVDQTATVFLRIKVSPHLLVKNTLKFAGLPHAPINITIPLYSYPEVSSVSLHRADGTEVTNDAAHSVSYTSAEVTTQFYGTDVTLNGSIFEFYVNYLSEEDFATYKLRLQNDIGLTEATVSIIHESIPETPKLFRFIGLIENVPQLFWEKGFNGGYKQYFVIETALTDTDDWVEQVRIDEDDQMYYLQPMQSYIINMTGISPGQYRARLMAENQIGQTVSSEEQIITFIIPKGDCECQNTNHCERQDDNIEVIVGVVGAAVIVVIIVAVVVCFLQRRRSSDGLENSSDLCSNICIRRGHGKPKITRQSGETYKNEVFEDDPENIGIEETPYVNEKRPTYESLQGHLPNPDTYETVATDSSIQAREIYETLGEGREQSSNYDSLASHVEHVTHGSKPLEEYENL